MSLHPPMISGDVGGLSGNFVPRVLEYTDAFYRRLFSMIDAGGI